MCAPCHIYVKRLKNVNFYNIRASEHFKTQMLAPGWPDRFTKFGNRWRDKKVITRYPMLALRWANVEDVGPT